MLGVLLDVGRRTVTGWLRATGEENEFRQHYYHLEFYGQCNQMINDRLAKMTLDQLEKHFAVRRQA